MKAATMNAPRYSTAVQQVNHPIHQGKPNDKHGKFFFVGAIPISCYDLARASSKFYDTETDAIIAAIEGGADVIQGADCRTINPADYATAPRRHRLYGRDFAIVAEFADTDKGADEANAFMLDNPGIGLLAVDAGRLILAALADKGIPAL